MENFDYYSEEGGMKYVCKRMYKNTLPFKYLKDLSECVVEDKPYLTLMCSRNTPIDEIKKIINIKLYAGIGKSYLEIAEDIIDNLNKKTLHRKI